MSEIAGRIKELSSRLASQLDVIKTEEATKNALVLPFISALGYDVFDPRVVTPELTADVGVKKGEKVDYAILDDGKPIILVECKTVGTNLDAVHASQLYRYFSVTEARFALLTNGIAYRFFTDLEARNKMDSKPFLEIDLRALNDGSLAELEKFSKEGFDQERILATASQLKYTKEIKRILNEEITDPSEDLVRFFVSRVYEGRMTASVKKEFTQITRRALREFISEKVSDRLKSALADEEAVTSSTVADTEAEPDDGIETTGEEWQAFYIVQAVVSKVLEPSRVAIRDGKTYCAVLLDDNNRQPICRLWFNTKQKYLGTFGAEKNETRNPIDSVEDVYKYADALRETALRYAD